MSNDETQDLQPDPQPHDESQNFDREDQLDAVIAGYLKAVESGQAPSEEELLARYPQFAEELKDFFTHRRQFEVLA